MNLSARSLATTSLPLLQAVVALAILAMLWHVADGPAALESLAAADWRWVALAFVALNFQTVLSALRWRLTARQLNLALGKGLAIREYYFAQAVNQLLPGGMIGDAGRALRTRGQSGLMASGQAVIFERLSGQIAMFLTLAIAFLITLVLPGGLDWPQWLSWSVAQLLAAALALPLLAGAATRLPGKAGRSAVSAWQALNKTLLSRAALPGQIWLGIGTTLCNLAAFAFCARAVGVVLGPGAITALVPLILLTMLIPISVAGWGLREGAAVVLLPIAGATASAGLAVSVTYGLTFLISVLPGIVMIWAAPRVATRKSQNVQPTGDKRTD